MKIAEAVAEETNLPFVTAENKFEALVNLSFKFSLWSLWMWNLISLAAWLL